MKEMTIFNKIICPWYSSTNTVLYNDKPLTPLVYVSGLLTHCYTSSTLYGPNRSFQAWLSDSMM